MSNLAESIVFYEENKDSFKNRPNFSKVIAVSYSAFDKFYVPDWSEKLPYVYCWLKKRSKIEENPSTLSDPYIFWCRLQNFEKIDFMTPQDIESKFNSILDELAEDPRRLIEHKLVWCRKTRL